MQIQVTLPQGIDPSLWTQKATLVAKAEAIKKDVDWLDVDLIVHTPQQGVILKKNIGHSLLMKHVYDAVIFENEVKSETINPDLTVVSTNN